MQVAAKILNNKELEFYKWDGDLSQLLQNVREKLNGVAEVISFQVKMNSFQLRNSHQMLHIFVQLCRLLMKFILITSNRKL